METKLIINKEREFRNYILGILYLLTVLYIANLCLFAQGVAFLLYFLLGGTILNIIGICLCYYVPNNYNHKMIVPLLIIKLVLLFPLNLFLLLNGISSILVWYIAVLIFVASIYQGKQLLRWFAICLCLMLASFALALLLRHVWNNNTPVNFGALPLITCIGNSVFNTIFAFVLSAYCIYYSQKFNQMKINRLQELLNLDSNHKELELLQENLEEEYKYNTIFAQIEKYFSEKRPYLDKKISIGKIAHDLNTNTTYISKAIRLKKEMNFATFVNSYRITHAKKLIETNQSRYTLEYIYLTSGFQNQPSFNKVFKTAEGITPSEYTEKFATK